jgi:hypothetical protein
MTTALNAHQDIHAMLAWARVRVESKGLDDNILADAYPNFTERDLLRELAWVVLCSGFREKVIRKHFWKISICFLDWCSAAAIKTHAKICVDTALDVFRSRPKLEAIAQSAALIDAAGVESVQKEIRQNPIEALQRFPFIGNVTAFHLAKNLGFNFAKPDRHLQRISTEHGYSNVQEFCAAVAEAVGDSVRNSDTLLWRISEMGHGALIHFPSITILPSNIEHPMLASRTIELPEGAITRTLRQQSPRIFQDS